jgi:hypothetical protein
MFFIILFCLLMEGKNIRFGSVMLKDPGGPRIREAKESGMPKDPGCPRIRDAQGSGRPKDPLNIESMSIKPKKLT